MPTVREIANPDNPTTEDRRPTTNGHVAVREINSDGQGSVVCSCDLPQGWVRARVQDVGDVQLGRQRAPKHHSGEHMRPYLRAANVTWSGLDLTDVLEMNFPPKDLETY